MHVIVVFDKWDEENISYILGPFDDIKAAQDTRRAQFDDVVGYRHVSIQKILTTAPEWDK